MPFERGSVVDIETDSLLLRSGSAVKVKWPRNFLVPSLESIDVEKGLVDVKLYERNFNSESLPFREIATLASKIPNTGETDVIIPDLSDVLSEGGICQVSINVEIKSLPTGNNLQKRRNIPKVALTILRALLKFSIWAGKLYLRVGLLDIATRPNYLHDKCQDWVNSQHPGIGEEILDLVSRFYPCPPTLNRAQAPIFGFEIDLKDSQIWPLNYINDWQRNFFHSNAFMCFHQSGGFE